MKVALVAAVVLLIAIGYLWSKRKARTGEPPPESIVLLLREPKKIDNGMLADAFSEESGLKVDAIAPDENASSDNFVMGKGTDPRFTVRINGTMFMVYSVPEVYGDKSQATLQSIADVDLRMAFARQNGWLSIDFIERQQATAENYRLVGRVLSRFADADCVALYYPPSNALVTCRSETIAALRSNDPISAIFRAR